MTSERMQRRIDVFLDQAEAASDSSNWTEVAAKARAVLAIDTGNPDAIAFLQIAAANGITSEARSVIDQPVTSSPQPALSTEPSDPEAFESGRYRVVRFLGEGGKKRVFLAHDNSLDRDIAFSLIRIEGLDDIGRERVMREARAMGRLTHQNIVSIYDIGEHTTADGAKQPYLVQELMGGGDVEDLLKEAAGPLPLQQALEIAIATARGLEYAHSQGLVHRDLKPGNVWLSSSGIAKIGDLGLAVTLGQSRLTTDGMMVGTYQYMPPEQALGHEVTPQADLYSLGAMLYELVTGRTPFQGDTPTAVISQHLNTQPVAPSWYTERCPPDLESLILKLLAKVPADRPASASEVIASLAAVNPEERSATRSDAGANPLDRLARGVFVGRDAELEKLRGSLDASLQGRGSIVMLVGDPGIGKTRTVQELETYARMRGASVYWGRAHESSGMPAYWPWLQIGRAWGAQQDFSGPAAPTAGLNPELLRLFPELRQVLPGLPEPDGEADSEAAQFNLFDAYTQFIRAQSATTPWVLVLDDLHWADKSSLQLLQFVARELTNMGVLIIGTYRDSELVRTHPLSQSLADLNRERGFQRISLRGLSQTEVGSYVRQRANVEPSRALVRRIHEETEGNPFFLSEVINLMAEEGTLSADSVSDIALPDGVREALGRRLDRLSDEANELLQVAAIVGREFAFETLNLMKQQDTDALVARIEEALEARVIEESERAGRYRFTHALMQETLLNELGTTRRLRLHGLVGEALEQRWGGRATEYAPQLAHHFLESATLTPTHAERAIRYLQLAAEQAEHNAAWAEAARDYEAIATLLEDHEDSAGRIQALIALGRCLRNSFNGRGAWRALMTARDLAQLAGNAAAAATASSESIGIMVAPGRLAALIQESLDHLNGDGAGDLEFKLQLGKYNLALKNGWDDQATDARADLLRLRSTSEISERGIAEFDGAELRRQFASGDFDATLTGLAAVAQRLPLNGGLSDLPSLIPCVYTAQARFTEARASLLDLLERYRRSHYTLMELNMLVALAAVEDATGHPQRAAEAIDEIPAGHMWRDLLRVRFAERAGNLTEAARRLPGESAHFGVPIHIAAWAAAHARIQAGLGNIAEAEQLVQQMIDALSGSGGARVELRRELALGELDSEIQTLLPESAAMDFLEELSTPADYHFGGTLGTNLDLVRAFLCIRLDRLDEAATHFRAGVEWAEREGCLTEAGRCHQGLADLAERAGDNAVARTHLDTAAEQFAQSGAKLYLEQVIARKEILKA